MPVASLGDRVRWLRNDRGWSIDELAKRAGVSGDAVWKIETDKVKRPYKLRQIAEAFGVPLSELRGNGVPHPDLDSNADEQLPVPPMPTFDVDVAAGDWQYIPFCGELKYDEPDQRAIIDYGRFRLRIRGDSMHPKYKNGSIVECVILRAYDAPDIGGAYAVCRNDNSATFKELVRITDDNLVLQAINKRKYPNLIEVPRQEVVRIAKAVGIFTPID